MALALKSKSGCLGCRYRRVKCDEVHPVCLRCQKVNRRCTWSTRKPVTAQYLKSNTILSNLYANICLQGDHYVTREQYIETNFPAICPARSLSNGFIPFRSDQEHQSLIRLSGFLSALANPTRDLVEHFPITVALQELWVRDALVTFAALLTPKQPGTTLFRSKTFPQYTSAIRAVRAYIAQDPDQSRLEQLLVATLFLGLIEFNNPENTIFPLLHFKAVGRFLEALDAIQQTPMLPHPIRYFHRVSLELYVYHTAVQSLFYPQTSQEETLSHLVDQNLALINVEPEVNHIVKLDLKIYVALFQLAQLAKLTHMSTDQMNAADRLYAHIHLMERNAFVKFEKTSSDDNPRLNYFWRTTHLAAGVLLILNAKVLDRSLASASATIRSLTDNALARLESCKPMRGWTGDFSWVLTILACAVYTNKHCETLSSRIMELAVGFGRSDLGRVENVLCKVRLWRKACAENQCDNTHGLELGDTLDILTEGRLSVEEGDFHCQPVSPLKRLV